MAELEMDIEMLAGDVAAPPEDRGVHGRPGRPDRVVARRGDSVRNCERSLPRRP